MPDSRERIIETLRERAVDPGMGWLNQAADLLTADAVEGDREATCALCGHEWRRHDPEDGQCDAHTAEPGEYGPCQCGRDLAWMVGQIAGLSRSALVSGGSVEGDRLDDECEHVYSYTSVDGRWFCADCTPGGGVEASREDRRTRLARHVERASAQVRSHPAYRPELDNPSLVPAAAVGEGGCRCSYCNGTGRKKVIGMVYSDREGVQAERDCDWCDGSGSRLPEPDQAGGLNPEAAKRYGCKKCGASLGQAHRRDCATGLGLAEECEHCTPVPTMGVVPVSNRWYFGGFVDDQNLRHDPMRHDPDCPMRQEPPKA